MKKRKIFIILIEIIIFIILYSFVNSKYINLIPQCWVYRQTGILCPACGGTRCLIYLLKGNWIQAFFSHMVFFVGIMYLLIFNFIYIVNLNKEKKICTWIYPKYWYIIIFAVILIIYTIIRNLL